MVKLSKCSTKDLKKDYKYVYKCSVCKIKYGSDKEETKRHLCPLHDLNFRDSKFKETFAKNLYSKEDKK